MTKMTKMTTLYFQHVLYVFFQNKCDFFSDLFETRNGGIVSLQCQNNEKICAQT